MIVPPTTEQLREMSAAPCPYWHNHTNPPATPASQEHTTEPVTCEDCIHFRRDVINPSTGLGWCELRKVSRYPMQPHYCKQRETDDGTRACGRASASGNHETAATAASRPALGRRRSHQRHPFVDPERVMSDTSQLWGKDRPMLMERLGRLLGSTTYRDQDSGGGTPFSARKLTAEAEMLLALKLAQTHPGDVGPWIVYSIALQIDDREREIVTWLAGKLAKGTGVLGKRNAPRLLIASRDAYQLAVHGIEPQRPKTRPVDYLALVNIGAGWLWMKCESAIDRAEFARHADSATLDVKGAIA